MKFVFYKGKKLVHIEDANDFLYYYYIFTISESRTEIT